MAGEPQVEQRRRQSDGGWTCIVARRLSELWDWVDKRDVDKHLMAVAIMFGTISVVRWAMAYAETGDRPGMEVAAIIAAVSAPYMALQAAALKWYFDARSE